MPNVAGVAQKIVHLVGVAFHGPELRRSAHEHRIAVAMRIEIHHDQNDVVARRRHLPVKQDRVVIWRDRTADCRKIGALDFRGGSDLSA